ncbi:MAG: JAB domain-containing protein [Bdellovibrionaceae bacterium]|nr:JAB domain-containing protein [Pseudobdellovibrionaceae bacterium]
MNSSIIFKHLLPQLDFDREVFWVVGLNASKEIFCSRQLFSGTVNKCVVYPREIFRYALLQNADEIAIAHTHTTTDISPSKKDLELTARLRMQSEWLDIKIVDHLIISKNHDYFSFFDKGLL